MVIQLNKCTVNKLLKFKDEDDFVAWLKSFP